MDAKFEDGMLKVVIEKEKPKAITEKKIEVKNNNLTSEALI